jgi:hypothetical protein
MTNLTQGKCYLMRYLLLLALLCSSYSITNVLADNQANKVQEIIDLFLDSSGTEARSLTENDQSSDKFIFSTNYCSQPALFC